MTDRTGESNPDAVAEAEAYKKRVTAELTSRGLKVTERAATLVVTNPGVGGTGALGRAMSPGLGQEIALRERPGLGLWWWWVWPGVRPGERGVPQPPPEYEPICPGEETGFVADRVTNVVRLRHDDDLAQEQRPDLEHRGEAPIGDRAKGR